MTMTKARNVLLMLAVIALSVALVPRLLPAETPPGQSKLSDTQTALLGAALAEKKSYAEIIKQAVAGGMECEEIVAFLCGKAGTDQTAVFEIVYAAITNGCDPGKVVSGALRSGANLQTVVRAARAAGANRDVIAAAAAGSGASAGEISNAFAGTSGGGSTVGPLGEGPLAGGIGGGGGGGVYTAPSPGPSSGPSSGPTPAPSAPQPASPYKP